MARVLASLPSAPKVQVAGARIPHLSLEGATQYLDSSLDAWLGSKACGVGSCGEGATQDSPLGKVGNHPDSRVHQMAGYEKQFLSFSGLNCWKF